MARCGGIVVVSLAALLGCTNDFDGLVPGGAATGSGASTASSSGSAGSGGAPSSSGPGGAGGAGPTSSSSSAGAGATGGSGPGGSGGTGGETPCKLAELQDDFMGNTLAPAWETTLTNGGQVQVHGGRLKVHPSGDGESGYSRAEIQSVDSYDLHDCSMHVRSVQPFMEGQPAAHYMKALSDAPNTWMRIGVATEGIRFEVKVDDVQTDTGGDVAFVPEDHVWWRIRELEGVTYFETSADKATWTTHLEATTPAFAGAVRANLGGSSYPEATMDPGEAHFDDFNE